MVKTKKKNLHNFTAIFEPAEEGGFVVHVPSLPGCHTEGDTFEEAETMAKDVIELYLKTAKDLKEDVVLEAENLVISRIPAIVS